MKYCFKLKSQGGGWRREGEMGRCLSSSLVFLNECEQPAHTSVGPPYQSRWTLANSSQHSICCYLIEDILLREADGAVEITAVGER